MNLTKKQLIFPVFTAQFALVFSNVTFIDVEQVKLLLQQFNLFSQIVLIQEVKLHHDLFECRQFVGRQLLVGFATFDGIQDFVFLFNKFKRVSTSFDALNFETEEEAKRFALVERFDGVFLGILFNSFFVSNPNIHILFEHTPAELFMQAPGLIENYVLKHFLDIYLLTNFNFYPLF